MRAGDGERGGSHGPTSQDGVRSEPSCSFGGSSRAERAVDISTLDFYVLLLLLSADLFGRRSCRGAANNGCSHFPAVRYLMTLILQPSFFFFFSLAQPAKVLPAASATQSLAPIAALHLPRDPALPRCPPAAKGLAHS